MICWNCGAKQRWSCRKCGSSEQRGNGKGCAECHRRSNRAGGPRQSAKPKRAPVERDFALTPAMRAYLAAFDAWLTARTGNNRRARAAALERLENDRG